MKIDTAYIKANVKCDECESTKLKRRHKQSFKSVIDFDGNVVPEFKVNWRVYECMDCEEEMHVVDNGTTILDASPYPMLPFNCFDYVIYDYEGAPHFDMFYKEDMNMDFLCEDDVRDCHMIGFQNYFKKAGFSVDNAMENTWEFNPPKPGTMRELIDATGATFRKELGDWHNEQ